MVLIPRENLLSTGEDVESEFHATLELIAKIKPISNVKGAPTDKAREEVNSKFHHAEALVKRVYVQHPNYDHIIDALLNVGLDGLAEHVPLTIGVLAVIPYNDWEGQICSLGIPLHPTLGSPARSLDEIYDRLQDLPFSSEMKYDGQRCLILLFKPYYLKLNGKCSSDPWLSG